LGDSTGFLIGHFGGRRLLLRWGPLIGLTPARLVEVERIARSRGFFMVLGARFVVVLRQLNGLVAGSVAMPWLHFVVANTLGAALWAGLWTLGPYYFADLFRRLF
jgi:membrane protein DedA with SNARE-associated domain